jgi:CheY-like chemotaxis protein
MTDEPWVLVVEDDIVIGEVIRDLLESEGYRVVVANDGATALRLVQAARPSLILLDLRMPRLDGRAFLAQLGPRTGARPPVILTTAANESVQEAMAAQVEAVVAKPFRLDELLAAVARHIQAG